MSKTTETFCDGCREPRKPYRYSPDGDDPRGLMFCFPCVKEGERDEAREMRAEALALAPSPDSTR